MTLETLFKAANFSVVPFWLLLLLGPRWRWTQRLVHGPVVLLLLTPMYAYLLFGHAPAPQGTSFASLYGVMIGFTAPNLVLAGWLHYLVFDLFVGAWESRDAVRRNIPQWIVAPCLVATFMVGPIGLLLYVFVRFVRTQVLEFVEDAGD